MSKKDYLIRYLLIIKRIRQLRLVSFKEINEYLEREFGILDSPKTISIRTFQRDINEIRTIFNIDIKCNSSNQYFINEEDNSDFNNRMMEAFDVFNSLSAGQQLTPYIQLESRCSLGTENINGILHSIRNRLVLIIRYLKYDDDVESTREVHPYILKEYKGRWYLLAKDNNDGRIKTFGLDRIQEIDITKKKYVYPTDLNPKTYFKNCFGIYISDDEPVEIILSFDPYQGNYIKSYPLHSSQKILVDNDTELRICLTLFDTHDLLMEVLSYGDNVRVIEPKSLIDKIVEVIENMKLLYK